MCAKHTKTMKTTSKNIKKANNTAKQNMKKPSHKNAHQNKTKQFKK